MARKKNDETNDIEKLRRCIDIIRGLVNIYSPTTEDDLADKFQYYFPKEYEELGEAQVFEIMDIMEENDAFRVEDEDWVTLYEEGEYEQLLKIDELAMLMFMDVEKEFDNPRVILNNADMFDVKGCKEFDELKDYFMELTKHTPLEEEDFPECIMVIYKMYDEEMYFNNLRRAGVSFDEEKLSELMVAYGGVMPRGIFNGYSWAEIGRIVNEEMEDMELMEDNRIEAPDHPLQFGTYTYEKCCELAKKLADTHIFDMVCSDNIIELWINEGPVFCQLLGYYNGDRNIIIYGDKDDLEYNYQFICGEAENYPDLVSRVNYSEVIIDDEGGFATPEVLRELKSRGLDPLPLIIDMDPVSGPRLSDEFNLDTIGAVLESLLIIERKMGPDLLEYSAEGLDFLVNQFYVTEDGISLGQYTDLVLGDPVLPFVNESLRDVEVSATEEAIVSIGIYTFSVLNERRPSYMFVVYDNDNGLILGGNVLKEEEMSKAKKMIFAILEENNIRPCELIFNNEFCEEVCIELCDIYDIEYPYDYDTPELDAIYMSIAESGDFPLGDGGLIH